MIELKLPCPLPDDRYWYILNAKISENGRLYREKVLEEVKKQKGDQRLFGRLSVLIIANFAYEKIKSINNIASGIIESLNNAHVWISNTQIDELSVRRGSSDGFLTVYVREI